MLFLLLWAVAFPANALIFREFKAQDGSKDVILVARDCEPAHEQCQEPEEHISQGDAETLESILQLRNYKRVMLNSGGGDLAEGVKIGEVLRLHSQYVVVPDGFSCVSACTISFLGGMLREVEPHGKYEMHAYSLLTEISAADLGGFVGPEAEFYLDKFAQRQQIDGMQEAKNLFMYVQRMLLGKPDELAVIETLNALPSPYQQYRNSAQRTTDLKHIQSVGVSAAQEVLMRIERDNFEAYLKALSDNSGRLGKKAEFAAKILSLMFSSRIQGTFLLDQKTLFESGIVNVKTRP